MKKQKTYVYEYPYSKEFLLEKLNNRQGDYHNWCAGTYRIEIKSDSRFFLGVGRAGHSGGDWYVADIEENGRGGYTVRGRIVYNPDENGCTPKESPGQRIENGCLCVLLLPLILAVRLMYGIRFLIFKIRRLPLPPTDAERRLDRFMADYLCCKKIEP